MSDSFSVDVVDVDKYQMISIEQFDQLAREKQFSDGPFISTFGDGPGHPYTPERNVWGTLVDGRKVRSLKSMP